MSNAPTPRPLHMRTTPLPVRRAEDLIHAQFAGRGEPAPMTGSFCVSACSGDESWVTFIEDGEGRSRDVDQFDVPTLRTPTGLDALGASRSLEGLRNEIRENSFALDVAVLLARVAEIAAEMGYEPAGKARLEAGESVVCALEDGSVVVRGAQAVMPAYRQRDVFVLMSSGRHLVWRGR